MKESSAPAFLIVCGKTTGQPMDAEYVRLATPVALEAGLEPIAGGEIGQAAELLEGSLPEGVNLLAIERFDSMEALKAFFHSDAYQKAIPFRANAFATQFIVAVNGLSGADLRARAEAIEAMSRENSV